MGYSTGYIKYGLILLVIASILTPITVLAEDFQNVIVPPLVPGAESRVRMNISLSGVENTFNSTMIYVFSYPSNISLNTSGEGILVFNETTLHVNLDMLLGLNIPSANTSSPIRVNGSIRGSIEGNASNINGNLTILVNVNSESMTLTYNIPLTIHHEGNDLESRTVVYTSNAKAVFMGNESKITLNNTIVTSNNKTTSYLRIRIEGQSPQVVYAAIMPLTMFIGGSVGVPSFNPATGKWYIEYTNTTETSINTTLIDKYRRLVREYNLTVESVKGNLNAHFNASSTSTGLRGSMDLKSEIIVKGSFRKGVPLDPNANNVLRRLTGRITLTSKPSRIVMEVDVGGEFSSLDPYLVQDFLNNVVPLTLSYSSSDSIVSIITSDDVSLYLRGVVYNKLVFTKSNASLAEETKLVVNGTVLTSPIDSSRIVYKQYAPTSKAYAMITASAGEVVVKLNNTNTTVFKVQEGVRGKRIVVEYGDDSIFAIEFSGNARVGSNTIVVERLSVLKEGVEEIPQEYRRVSDYYYVDINLSSGKVNVTLPFSKVKAGDEVYVAHWYNNAWQIVKPKTVDKAEGYVIVELSSLSPLTVVSRIEEASTTPTETQPTTTPTETTTTTTTTTQTTQPTTTTTTQTTPTTTTETTTTITRNTTTTTTQQTSQTTTTKTTITTSTSKPTTTTTTTTTQTTTSKTTVTEPTTKPTVNTTSKPTTTKTTEPSTTSKPTTSQSTPTTTEPKPTQPTKTVVEDTGEGLPLMLVAGITIVVVVIVAVALIVFKRR